MSWDDIVYTLLLLFSIAVGKLYRNIEDVQQKKIRGSLIGLGIMILVSGLHTLHILILTSVNIFIILFLSKRSCHLISFGFSFLYLLFFRTTIYFGIPYPPAHTNLVIMILTLKLVGLAFEVNTTYMRKKQEKKELTEEQVSEYELTDVDPGLMDIVHYAFNYVGVLTGPYYSYRTFWDSIHLPYHKMADCDLATVKILKSVPLYAVLFLLTTYLWPLSYALSDEFYDERSWLYRLYYVIPIFCMFRFRIYTGILLSVCVCTMAGIGAYPTFTEPKPGRGPSKNHLQLKKLDANALKNKEYGFETVENISPYDVETCTTFREAMKYWNMTIQYWMAICVYKRFPSKKYRTLVTLLVSAFWHGVYIGHYFCIGGAPVYLPIEDLYVKLFLKDNYGPSRKIWQTVIWISKMMTFSYLGMAFQLLTVSNVMRFYNSIYHVGIITGIILYGTGIMILKSRPRASRNAEEIISRICICENRAY